MLVTLLAVVMKIVIGSYEGLLLGYTFDTNVVDSTKSTSGETHSLIPFFSNGNHSQSIRSLSVSLSGRLVASGGSDEQIQLFNMRSKKEIGSIREHVSSVSCTCFVSDLFLITASIDGAFCAWNCEGWERVARFQFAPRGIEHIAMHPNHTMFFSIGFNDLKLRLWKVTPNAKRKPINCVHTSTLESQPTDISFSATGAYYALLFDRSVCMYETVNCSTYGELKSSEMIDIDLKHSFGCKLTAICPIKLDQIDSLDSFCVGSDLGHAIVLKPNSDEKSCTCIFDTKLHDSRLKSIMYVAQHNYLVCGFSDGKLMVSKFVNDDTFRFEKLAEFSTGVRITCLNVAIAKPVVKSKRKLAVESRVAEDLPQCNEADPDNNQVLDSQHVKVKKVKKIKLDG